MNLKEWAAATGVSYVTARRQYAAGMLPVPTYRLGRLIMVGEPLTGAAPKVGQTVVYARVSSVDQKREPGTATAGQTGTVPPQGGNTNRVLTKAH
ncbi:hypothetical protein [Catellatospora tritici]|uniref:hypothetical protein n=1 Tax=Catellatospora tritici TaxID=2851566 RepID=UPI001C2D4550|nr:hypothetical protein [Catellatospora tritici]MBV1856523.1 hypothetical protein [Catellatospora tritici]